MKNETIQSLKELQLRMPAIIKQYGSNNDLTHIALANPIIALERTGLKFTDQAKEEIEMYVRFGKEGVKWYNSLKEKIDTLAGTKIDLRNNEQIAEVIFRKESAPTKKSSYTAGHDKEKFMTALNSTPKKTEGRLHDDLAAFTNVHPLIPLLIEYRQIQAEHPPFTHPKDISRIEERLRKGPLMNVVFKLKRDNN